MNEQTTTGAHRVQPTLSAAEHDRLQAVPDEARRMWREHWGLFAAAADGRAALLVHISTDPVRREGVFTVIGWLDGERHKDIHRAPVPGYPGGRTRIATPALTVDILEAGHRCRVTYRGAGFEADVE